MPFKYGHAAGLTILVLAALWLGVGLSLPLRLGILAGFVGAAALLDGQDLLKAARGLKERR